MTTSTILELAKVDACHQQCLWCYFSYGPEVDEEQYFVGDGDGVRCSGCSREQDYNHGAALVGGGCSAVDAADDDDDDDLQLRPPGEQEEDSVGNIHLQIVDSRERNPDCARAREHYYCKSNSKIRGDRNAEAAVRENMDGVVDAAAIMMTTPVMIECCRCFYY